MGGDRSVRRRFRFDALTNVGRSLFLGVVFRGSSRQTRLMFRARARARARARFRKRFRGWRSRILDRGLIHRGAVERG